MDVEKKQKLEAGIVAASPKTEPTDQISKLPDAVLEHILTLLPPKDAVRTRSLSQTWKLYWDSLPTLTLDSDCVDFVAQHMRAGREDSFRVGMTSCTGDPFRITKLCHLIKKPRTVTRQLDIFTPYPVLTPHITTLCSLTFITSLNLWYCKLSRPSGNVDHDGLSFACLKELHLRSVSVEDEKFLNDLLSRSPLLRVFHLEYDLSRAATSNALPLRLVDLPYLEEVTLFYNLLEIQISGTPKLRTLRYDLPWEERGKLFDPSEEARRGQAWQEWGLCQYLSPYVRIRAADCYSVKNLEIGSFSIRTNHLVQKFLHYFPSVETLALGYTIGVLDLKISSHRLKNLHLRSRYLLGVRDVVKIDAPNLRTYSHVTPLIPSSFSLAPCSQLQEATLDFRPYKIKFNAVWVCRLRKYLGAFGHCRRSLSLIIDFEQVCAGDEFVPSDELKGVSVSPAAKVARLEIIKQVDARNALVVDALLWCCRPETISCNMSEELGKFLCEYLVVKDETLSCCVGIDDHVKCWRHYLKEVERKDPYEFRLQWFTMQGY